MRCQSRARARSFAVVRAVAVCSKVDRVLDDEGWGSMTAVAPRQGILRLDMRGPFPVEDDRVSHAPLYSISEAALFLGQNYETFRTGSGATATARRS